MEYEMPVTGTDIWYYFICKREVWLLKHGINADQEDENIEIGKFLHDYYYKRDKKEQDIGVGKVDKLKTINGDLVVQEVKKSSKYVESAKMQLLYYLDNLRKQGLYARGEILFPEERKKEYVVWTEEESQKLKKVVVEIRELVKSSIPPLPKKIKFCRSCAYREYCWAEENG